MAIAAAAGLLLGGTLATVTPAGASLATNWKQIWKQEIKPRADKRYYTKAFVKARYETKAAHEASLGLTLGSYYTKSQSDARYAPVGSLGSFYTKTESNARYAPYPNLIQGAFMDLNGTGAVEVDSPISFGVQLAAAPTVHYIKVGDPVPPGCAGTVDSPDAAVGHLCVFEQAASNLTTRGVANPATGTSDQATTFGAYVYGIQAAAGQFWFRGTWALRPGAVVASSLSTATSGGLNVPQGRSGLTR